MTDFKFGKKTVLHVHQPENERLAQAVLEETYRNYTGQSNLVGSEAQINADPNSRMGQPALVEGILDVSGSMGEELNGECKMDIFKLLLLNTINRMIAEPIGARTTFLLRLLGQSSQTSDECHKTELVVPPGRLREITHYKALVDKILSLKPDGPTPLAFSLVSANIDINSKYAYIPGTRHVLLFSDGVQTSTCHDDPVKAAEQLKHNATIDGTTLGMLPKDGDSEEIVIAKRIVLEQLGQIATARKLRHIEFLSDGTKGAPPVGQNTFGQSLSGKYVFPSPSKTYGEMKSTTGEVQATTHVDGKVLLPKKENSQ